MVGLWSFARKPASFCRRYELARAWDLSLNRRTLRVERRFDSMTGGILAGSPTFATGGATPVFSHLYVRAKRVITRTPGNYSPLFEERYLARRRSSSSRWCES